MYTIKLDVNDKIYDKVMFFLKSIPVKNIRVEKIKVKKTKDNNDIVSFFQSSPIAGEVLLERESQEYTDRINFWITY